MIRGLGQCLAPFSGCVCMVKSALCPGTLYSYGPRWICTGRLKLPCGGGVGVSHSTVVACHGFSGVFLPRQRVQKKLMINGSCARQRKQAAIETYLFRPRMCGDNPDSVGVAA